MICNLVVRFVERGIAACLQPFDRRRLWFSGLKYYSGVSLQRAPFPRGVRDLSVCFSLRLNYEWCVE